MSVTFYADLPAFTTFEQFTEPARYAPVPDDWLVYVTDVVNSTRAIETGQYKDVNMIGAASITLCLGVLPEVAFPFQFGGDGATLCIPPAHRAVVDAELGGLVRLAATNFGLTLRVARVPMSELRARGEELSVAKFALPRGNLLAFFRGGGVALAERLAKAVDSPWGIAPAPEAVEELTGLSCRWSPIPAQRGCIVSLLVQARTDHPEYTYARVLTALRAVLGTTLEEASPVALDQVTYKSLWRSLREESRYHRGWLTRRFWDRVVDIVCSTLIFRPKRDLTARWYDRRRYVDSVRDHSDYRKFDETLRMVLDCTAAQADAMEALLAQAHAAGELCYGLHRSTDALMTCFVQTTQDREHLHFIDGGGGGFAMAAQQYKAQVAALVLLGPRN
jgi:hypothetical protein